MPSTVQLEISAVREGIFVKNQRNKALFLSFGRIDDEKSTLIE